MKKELTDYQKLARKGWRLRFWETGEKWEKGGRKYAERLHREAKRRDKRIDRKMRQMANYGDTLERILLYAAAVFLAGMAAGAAAMYFWRF